MNSKNELNEVKKYLIKMGFSESDALKLMNSKQEGFFNLNSFEFYSITHDEKIILNHFKKCFEGELMGS